jgi:hypothetical protein
MMKALDHLRATGNPVNEADLMYLSPILWDHITLHGSYHFDLAGPQKRQGLRPLKGVATAATGKRHA